MDTVKINLSTLLAICNYLTIQFRLDKESKHIAPLYCNNDVWSFAVLDSDNNILKTVDLNEINDIKDIIDLKKYFL